MVQVLIREAILLYAAKPHRIQAVDLTELGQPKFKGGNTGAFFHTSPDCMD